MMDQLRLPLIAAPMFLVSGIELVKAASKAGIIGTFPALNQRTTESKKETRLYSSSFELPKMPIDEEKVSECQ